MARNPDKKPSRFKQISETYKITKQSDPKIGWILLGIFIGVWALASLIGFLVGMLVYFAILGFAVAALATVFIFGRRAEKAAYAQIKGKAGAASAVLNSLRRGWFVTPAIAVTRQQDCVHRVVGKPGVILVSEGPSNRVTQLLAVERKKTARYVPDVPIIEIQSGDDPDQVSLRKLNRKIMKQKKALKPAQVTEVRKRLEALSQTPMSTPKGPLPKSVRAGRPRG
jgi:hypothetical protein